MTKNYDCAADACEGLGNLFQDLEMTDQLKDVDKFMEDIVSPVKIEKKKQ